MTALVAGGAGLIGSHLVDALIERGDAVTVVDNFSTGRHRNLVHLDGHPSLALVEVDVALPLPPALTDTPFDRVYHLASPASPADYGRLPVETLFANALGTRHVLDLALLRPGARFLLASTSEVYGDPHVHPQPEDYWGNVNPVGPRSPYDEGKRFAESLTVTYNRERGLDVRVARNFNTYGPRAAPDDGRLVPNLCVHALTGAPLTLYGDGTQTRSHRYVADLVRGLIALIETDGIGGEVVNLGNPDEASVAAVADRVAALAGATAGIVRHPLPADDPARRRPDITKSRRLLGWQPTVPLDDGLTRTLDHFHREFGLPVPPVPADAG